MCFCSRHNQKEKIDPKQLLTNSFTTMGIIIYIFIYLSFSFQKHQTLYIIKNISDVEAKEPAAIYVTLDDTPYVHKKSVSIFIISHSLNLRDVPVSVNTGDTHTHNITPNKLKQVSKRWPCCFHKSQGKNRRKKKPDVKITVQGNAKTF